VTLTGDTTITADGTQKLQDGIAAASLNFIGTISDTTPGNNSTIIKKRPRQRSCSRERTRTAADARAAGHSRIEQSQRARPSHGEHDRRGGRRARTRIRPAGRPVLINGDGIPSMDQTLAPRNVANNNVYTGTLTLGTNTTIGPTPAPRSPSERPEGIITGTGTITDREELHDRQELAGTLVLASPNITGGTMTVDQGALRVEDGQRLGASGEFSGTYVRDGARCKSPATTSRCCRP